MIQSQCHSNNFITLIKIIHINVDQSLSMYIVQTCLIFIFISYMSRNYV